MMWQQLFSGPWPDADNLLPPPAQAQAAHEIRDHWRWRLGWQLVAGEVILVVAVHTYTMPGEIIYGLLALGIGLAYLLGWFARLALPWLISLVILLMVQGMVINGFGAVTALAYMTPYTFSGLLLAGRQRVFVQSVCMVAFWISLIYEVLPVFNQLEPPNYILVSYNILLAAFTFQSLRFLYQLAVQLNRRYTTDRMREQSQQFLARVSHELRTPLNSVLGFAKLLHRTDLTEAQRRYLAQIIDESEQLNRLVSDLLDSAHLSTGKLTLNREPVDINALCTAVAEEHRPSLTAAVALTVDLSPEMPSIPADRVRLRQIVSNLVSNAVKYTAAGTITISTHQHDDRVHIAVSDTGRGISDEEKQLIFVPFVQLDSRRIGVGLGLDIALQLTRLHGGTLHVESAPGAGSTFTVELPLHPPN